MPSFDYDYGNTFIYPDGRKIVVHRKARQFSNLKQECSLLGFEPLHDEEIQILGEPTYDLEGFTLSQIEEFIAAVKKKEDA